MARIEIECIQWISSKFVFSYLYIRSLSSLVKSVLFVVIAADDDAVIVVVDGCNNVDCVGLYCW